LLVLHNPRRGNSARRSARSCPFLQRIGNPRARHVEARSVTSATANVLSEQPCEGVVALLVGTRIAFLPSGVRDRVRTQRGRTCQRHPGFVGPPAGNRVSPVPLLPEPGVPGRLAGTGQGQERMGRASRRPATLAAVGSTTWRSCGARTIPNLHVPAHQRRTGVGMCLANLEMSLSRSATKV
jgi:hypothetical protein